METTYDSYFATELVLDLTSLDRARRVLLNELEKVFDTHPGRMLRSVACGMSVQLVSLCVGKLGYRQQLEAGEGSKDRTDYVTSKTRAGITRSHGYPFR
jgi:hypothetical protein